MTFDEWNKTRTPCRHDVPEFANIYEFSYDADDNFNWLRYYQLRDAFIENNESDIRHKYISVDDFVDKFTRKPNVQDKRFLALAEATAESYLKRYTTQLPSWCFDDKCDEYDPLFTHPVFSPYDLELFIDNTPAEFRKRNVFCENNHLEYR